MTTFGNLPTDCMNLPIEYIALFVAGLAGGVVNSIAGGGSFITFPALILVGLPAISANATNTFASCLGYFSGLAAFKQQLVSQSHRLIMITAISLMGGGAGALLLATTPAKVFQNAIPWLLLIATILFVWGPAINQKLQQRPRKKNQRKMLGVLPAIMLSVVCLYGGFFNAGLGIILLSYFSVLGIADINVMNALKLYVSGVLSVMAITVFMYQGYIDWLPGSILMLGTMLGGYIAAKMSLKASQQVLRNIVIVIAVTTTTYFFIDAYAF